VGERRPRGAFIAAVLVCVFGAIAGATAGSAKAQTLDLALCDPHQHTFTTNITNQFFPLPVGQEWVYFGVEQGEPIGLRITVLNETETFKFGRTTVTTLVVEELEWIDANRNNIVDPGEELLEVSRNFYAQTEEGTVCYFGETVDIYEEGVIVSHEGAWRADDKRNKPGIFMPANPQKGMTFQQEFAPGVAEDEATIIKVGKDAITVRDFNPLDGSSGTKVYQAGVGLVRDGPLDLVGCSGPISC
jgi:hypothetical protein